MTDPQTATSPSADVTTGGPAALGGLSAEAARALFAEHGCGSREWASRMADGRPYATVEELLAAARAAFDALGEDDWREAFAAHAEIGAPRAGDDRGAAEQAGAARADAGVLAQLRAGNDRYRARFGHVFLIRARDRSAEEMLAALHGRLANSPARELANAAAAQREITELRLRELAAG